MRMSNCTSEIHLQLRAIQDDLFRVHIRDGTEWHAEIAGILDIDHEIVAPHLAHRPERLVAVVYEHIKAFSGAFLKDVSSSSDIAGNGAVMWGHPAGEIEHELVDIAPTPTLRRIVAFDDRMMRGMKMLRRVTVRELSQHPT